MTRFARRNAGSSHSYTLDGWAIPGVTTIIGILDKPALVNWAAEQSASFAVENWARLSEVPLVERMKQIQGARHATNRAAVVKGNRIHALAEKLQKTGDSGEVPAAILPQVEAVARMLDDWQMETVHAEMPVCNTNYRYAGTADTIVTSPRLGTVLIDWKTGKRIYAETAMQLAAYQACDLILTPHEIIGPRGGRKTEWREHPMPEVDGVYAAHVLADSIDLRPMHVDADVLTAFLYLREVYDLWILRTGYAYRDRETYRPPVGAPIYIEDRPIEGMSK